MIKVADIKEIGFKKNGVGVWRLDTETKHFFWSSRKKKTLFVWFTDVCPKEGLCVNIVVNSTEGGISVYQLKDDGNNKERVVRQYKVENIKCISDMEQLVWFIIHSFPKMTY